MLASKIAEGIVKREIKWKIHGRVSPGPADTQIFRKEQGVCIAKEMRKKLRINGRQYPGVRWKKADKRPGTRHAGRDNVLKRLANAKPNEAGIRERPGMFIFKMCQQWKRVVPSLPRDEKDPDDVDTESEDHLWDETRYALSHAEKKGKRSSSSSTGQY
jgi:hypothetical protein